MEISFLEILKVIFLGIVEGVTEWLPISSTGHMILLNDLVHLNVSDAFWEMFEVVIHDMPKDQAIEHIQRMRRFYTAGWKTIFFGDGGENH